VVHTVLRNVVPGAGYTSTASQYLLVVFGSGQLLIIRVERVENKCTTRTEEYNVYHPEKNEHHKYRHPLEKHFLSAVVQDHDQADQ
jgi:hypothetical protein